MQLFKNNPFSSMKKVIFTLLAAVLSSAAHSQCQSGSFNGLQPAYTCPDPSELYGNPFGGIFQGPGVTGDFFSPALAGVGTHVVSYTTPPSSPVAGYIATAGLPNTPETVGLTSVFLMDDDLTNALPIGFNFNFFGASYSEFIISSNGFITFDLMTWDSGCCSGQNIPDTWESNNLIALGWNDLNPSNGGTIGYTTIGSAPNRVLIVDFSNVPHYGGGGTPVTAQIKLFEGTDIIEIHCTQSSADGSNHTIGVENASGTCGVTAMGMNANPGLSVSNEMIRFTADAGSYYGHVTGLATNPYAGAMTTLTLANNELSNAVPLGFSFDFYGTNYTAAYVSSNGFLTFSNDGNDGCCSGDALPNVSIPNNLIAFAWNDLDPSLGGAISYTTIGAAPNRIFVLDFMDIQHAGGGNPITVQVKLFETSNLIEVHSTNNTTNGSNMTMGLENATGTEANTPDARNANNLFSIVNERTIFYPYYTTIQLTEVISVTDVEAPMPYDPFPMSISAECSVQFLDDQYAEDNCSGFIFGTSNAIFPITESTIVTWTFEDAAGNSTTIEQEVIIEDLTEPVASGFIITITAEGWVTDEVVWSFTDGGGTVVASGGPYWGGGQGEVLEVAYVDGTNGPYSFMGTTAGSWNDNVFSYQIQCQGETVASGLVDAGLTVNVNNIEECNSFVDIVADCELTSLDPVFATDNCEGSVEGTNDAIFPITATTTVTWTFTDGSGNTTTQTQEIIIENNLDNTFTISGNSLIANETAPGVTYTWVDCANNFAPVGVSTVSFTPSVGGLYAVILELGGCTAMSNCINMSGAGLENLLSEQFKIYPNPATDHMTISANLAGKMELYDVSGKILLSTDLDSGEYLVGLDHIASGAYTVRFISSNGVTVRSLIINRN
jgi:hypothetical protein